MLENVSLFCFAVCENTERMPRAPLNRLDTPQGVWQGTEAGTGGGGQCCQQAHNPHLSVMAHSCHGDPGILTMNTLTCTHACAHTQRLPCPVLLGRWKRKTH